MNEKALSIGTKLLSTIALFASLAMLGATLHQKNVIKEMMVKHHPDVGLDRAYDSLRNCGYTNIIGIFIVKTDKETYAVLFDKETGQVRFMTADIRIGP